jgi:hypothetical protein
MDRFINFDLLTSPVNWLVILAMLLIWAFFFDLLQTQLSGRSASDNTA